MKSYDNRNLISKTYDVLKSRALPLGAATVLTATPVIGALADGTERDAEDITIEERVPEEFCVTINKGDIIWKHAYTALQNKLSELPEEERNAYTPAQINRATTALVLGFYHHTKSNLEAQLEADGMNPRVEAQLARMDVDNRAVRDGKLVHEADGVPLDLIHEAEIYCATDVDLEQALAGEYDINDALVAVPESCDEGTLVDPTTLDEDEFVEYLEGKGLTVIPGRNFIEVGVGGFYSNEQPENLGGVRAEVEGVLSLDDGKNHNLVLTTDNELTAGPFWGNVEGGLVVYRGVHGLAVLGKTSDGKFLLGGGPVLAHGFDGIVYDGHKLNSGRIAGGGQFRLELGETDYTSPLHFDSTVWAALGIQGQNGEMDMGAAMAYLGIDARVDMRLSDNARLNAEVEAKLNGRVDRAESLRTDTSSADIKAKLGVDFLVNEATGESAGPFIEVGGKSTGPNYFLVGAKFKSRK